MIHLPAPPFLDIIVCSSKDKPLTKSCCIPELLNREYAMTPA